MKVYVMRDTDMFVRESPFPIPVGILYLWSYKLDKSANVLPTIKHTYNTVTKTRQIGNNRAIHNRTKKESYLNRKWGYHYSTERHGTEWHIPWHYSPERNA